MCRNNQNPRLDLKTIYSPMFAFRFWLPLLAYVPPYNGCDSASGVYACYVVFLVGSRREWSFVCGTAGVRFVRPVLAARVLAADTYCRTDAVARFATAFTGVEGGLGAAVDVPSGSVDMPSASVDMPSASVDMPSASVDMPSASVDIPSASADMPSVDLSGKGPDMPSVEGEVSGDLPTVDAKLTGPDVDVEGGGGVSLGAGLAAGVTAAVGAAAVGLGLSGKADKPEGEVCCMVCMCVFCIPSHCGKSQDDLPGNCLSAMLFVFCCAGEL